MTTVLIIHAPGSNRVADAAEAVEHAGGLPLVATMQELAARDGWLQRAQMLLLPGGFSYGDHLGGGRLWGLLLRQHLGAELQAFVEAGWPVLGICNGFQALLALGALPGPLGADEGAPEYALAPNASGRFECRWVELEPEPSSACVFTARLAGPIAAPAAHAEGRFVASSEAALDRLESSGLVALRYTRRGSSEVGYPANPNGSARDIAGICNAQGNVLGLMPHPENDWAPSMRPAHVSASAALGVELIAAGIRWAREQSRSG